MPMFDKGSAIESMEQEITAQEYAEAFYAAQDSLSLMHKKEIKAGLCVSAAIIIGSFIPFYRTHFISFWLPAGGITIALLLAFLFYFVQPKDIKRWAVKLYEHNLLLSLPEKITVYRDCVIVQNSYEEILEYWTDFWKCIETKSFFAAIGGRERKLLIMKKQGLTNQQIEKLSAHFEDAFASRYQKSGR